MYRTTDPAATTDAPRAARSVTSTDLYGVPYFPARVAGTVVALILIVALASVAASAAQAGSATRNVAAVRAATTPIDTGNRSEDSQPGYTKRLARAGWDYNPNCDGVHDWYPVGHRCHSGHVVYPSGATVPPSGGGATSSTVDCGRWAEIDGECIPPVRATPGGQVAAGEDCPELPEEPQVAGGRS